MEQNFYNVIVSQRAKKDLLKINQLYVGSIVKALKGLEYNPRPFGSIKLAGSKSSYRIRVGVYRIIYTIEDNILTVNVVKIDHRRNVYQ
ncbi:MAG: type II toxin-antitoxin system RelE/ParE family toxin [Dysgonamonadaceae bacterium]|jgi:mRNA interferase RelE/StbE|nr:type II toxin-antitoxin system RelE/ParE family toxin [Dysgonamonadaceae bacterium]